jgi:hypothetical protein
VRTVVCPSVAETKIRLVQIAVIDDYALPAKTAFPSAMPRYPNAWFYIDASLAPSLEAPVRPVTAGLRQAMHLQEYYPPFDNPEGCDFEVRVEHLQPWIDPAHRSLQHAHAFHMRYYYNPLVAAGLEKVVFRNRAADSNCRAIFWFAWLRAIGSRTERAGQFHSA